MLKEIESGKIGIRPGWRIFMQIINLRGQSHHVESPERELIQKLSKRSLSIRELAFIFSRSIETIHKIVSEIKPSERLR